MNELPDIVKDIPDDTLGDNDEDIVIYADDNTPITSDKDPLALQTEIQDEADCVTTWFSKNDMICSSEKTKLLVIGTAANRKSKLENDNLALKVNVCGVEKCESPSEKLLGVLVNNTATFRNHLYGDTENKGLLKELSIRVGMLRKLKKHMPGSKLKPVMEGMFGSKLGYAITVWGRVWNIPGSLDEAAKTRTSPSLTKEDVRKLQVLHNKCLRMVTDCDYKTPTEVLLKKTNSLSVHQRIAHLSLSQVYNIHKTKLPAYHHSRLFVSEHGDARTRSTNNFQVNRIEFDLSLARSNFFYQPSRLWSATPDYIKAAPNKTTFKKMSKSWVKLNITRKP